MLRDLRIILFLMISNYFKCIITNLQDHLKSKRLLDNYITTQPVPNHPSQMSDNNMTQELSLAQGPAVLKQHNVILRVYTGSVTKFHCRLNPRQVGKDTVMWLYSPILDANEVLNVLNNLSFSPLQDDETIISKWNLSIYNTKLQHAGVYRCATKRHRDAVILLEVVDEEKYDVVKPLSSNGPYASRPVQLNSQLTMFNAWSEWSECSRCNVVGRKRRYGICYIALSYESIPPRSKQNASIEKTLKLFYTFPEGIPCRSQILPLSIKNIRTVQLKKNEIMIALCKIKCKKSILNILSKSGHIIETVNNTAGIYSLSQQKPPQPPLPARSIMYVEPGKKVVIKCCGTTLRDIPFTWQVDTQEVSPKDLDRNSNGRVHLNARDHIVFTSVLYSDAHVYSCWQADMAAGVVKLRVQRGAESTYRARFALFTAIIILTMLLRLTMRLLRHRRRYLGIS